MYFYEPIINSLIKNVIMALKLIDFGSKEYKLMVEMRLEILRKPLGLTFSKEELEKEKDDVLIGAFDEDEILGCCILTKVDDQQMKLRQMAVQKSLQGKGIGESIINFAENITRDRGFKYLKMHARDAAVGFYEKFGYVIQGAEFTEVNIKHYLMVKKLL